MSAPAQTYFCGNGHIILELGYGEVVMFEDIPLCPHCDNKNVYMTLEWHDYGDKDVPHTPISISRETKVIDIPVYDISNLKERQGDGIGETNERLL